MKGRKDGVREDKLKGKRKKKGMVELAIRGREEKVE